MWERIPIQIHIPQISLLGIVGAVVETESEVQYIQAEIRSKLVVSFPKTRSKKSIQQWPPPPRKWPLSFSKLRFKNFKGVAMDL
jgi:hypothetical protein